MVLQNYHGPSQYLPNTRPMKKEPAVQMLFHRQTTMVALHRKTRGVYGIEKYQ
jgi:hypothetical protein